MADLVIPYGPRAFVSLAGIALIIGGVWKADRLWDEKGSEACAKAASQQQQQGATDKTPLTGVTIPNEELDAAFPTPWAFMLGWSLFGISYFSPTDGSEGFVVTIPAVLAALVSLAIGWIASVPMGDAVKYRNGPKKTRLGMMFVASWLALTMVSGFGELSALHAVFRALGAITIIASMKVLWKFRKMGDTWEQQGRPNPNPVVYNMGGPMFVFGWFLFWVGMCAVSPEDGVTGLPLYFTSRSALAFISGCGMVPVVMVVDYAHDEGAEWLGFGTDGRYFGRFLESPIPFLSFWTLFGVACLLPFGEPITTLQWIIVANCVAQGFVAGILIQNALYKGDLAGKTRYSIPFVLLFLALAIEIGLGNGWYGLSVPGAILVIAGQKTVFGDRKRGDYWMEHQEVNPNPIVYSWGEPLFMLGWLLLSLAQSIPFNE